MTADVIETVIDRARNDGDGTIYFEDVQEVVHGLGIPDNFATKVKVANALEQIVYNREAAEAYRDDTQKAIATYCDEGYLNPDFVDRVIEGHEIEAENYKSLLKRYAVEG